MLFFPRTDDTIDFKKLVKAGVFEITKNSGVKFGTIISPGSMVNKNNYSFDYEIEYVSYDFDRDYIYYKDEPISLSDLLVGKAFKKQSLTEDVEDILRKRGLTTEMIMLGTRDALYSDDKTGDSRVPAYLIIKEGENY